MSVESCREYQSNCRLFFERIENYTEIRAKLFLTTNANDMSKCKDALALRKEELTRFFQLIISTD